MSVEHQVLQKLEQMHQHVLYTYERQELIMSTIQDLQADVAALKALSEVAVRQSLDLVAAQNQIILLKSQIGSGVAVSQADLDSLHDSLGSIAATLRDAANADPIPAPAAGATPGIAPVAEPAPTPVDPAAPAPAA
jgi:hypothetical protein